MPTHSLRNIMTLKRLKLCPYRLPIVRYICLAFGEMVQGVLACFALKAPKKHCFSDNPMLHSILVHDLSNVDFLIKYGFPY